MATRNHKGSKGAKSTKGTKRSTPALVGSTLLEQLRGPSTSDPETRGLRHRAFAMFALVGVLVAGHVWVRLQSQELGYADRDLERLIQRLDQERLDLLAAVGRESAPNVMRARAAELGLREASPGQVRRIRAQP